MKVLVVSPCFNESQRLPQDEFLNFVETHKEIEILFVNDGSTDNTSTILTSLCTKSESLHLLDLQHNRGKAEAIREGFLYAISQWQFENIAFWDADLQIPLSELITFIQMADEGFDVVMAMRIQRLGATMKRSMSRHILSRCFATCASITLNLPVYDTQCGAKLFKRNIVEGLFSEPFISKWLFDIELLARYKKQYGREATCKNIFEQPLRHLVDADGTNIKLMDWMKSPFELFKIRNKYK